MTRGTRNVGELLCSVTNDRLDLLPNITVDVRIHISERPNVLWWFRAARCISMATSDYVFRVEDDRLHRRDIKVGIANPTKIEVLSGLNEGDVVGAAGRYFAEGKSADHRRCARNEAAALSLQRS